MLITTVNQEEPSCSSLSDSDQPDHSHQHPVTNYTVTMLNLTSNQTLSGQHVMSKLRGGGVSVGWCSQWRLRLQLTQYKHYWWIHNSITKCTILVALLVVLLCGCNSLHVYSDVNEELNLQMRTLVQDRTAILNVEFHYSFLHFYSHQQYVTIKI